MDRIERFKRRQALKKKIDKRCLYLVPDEKLLEKHINSEINYDQISYVKNAFQSKYKFEYDINVSDSEINDLLKILEKKFDEVKMKKLKKGDHVYTIEKDKLIPYMHHGLYVGNGEVIHYTKSSNNKAIIAISSLKEFIQNNTFKIKEHENPKYNREERVKRAYSKLGEQNYNLFFNNCEHFVTWCILGTKRSKQVQLVGNLLTWCILGTKRSKQVQLVGNLSPLLTKITLKKMNANTFLKIIKISSPFLATNISLVNIILPITTLKTIKDIVQDFTISSNEITLVIIGGIAIEETKEKHKYIIRELDCKLNKMFIESTNLIEELAW